jgi:flavoprotein
LIKKEDFEDIIVNVMIDYIVEKVIDKIMDYNKTALVLFTGASIGFSQSIKALRTLKGEGWKFKVIITKGAENALGKSLLQDLLSIDDVITDDTDANVNKLINDYKFIIIPSLTINTASKIVNCISDNLVTNIISHSMIVGKSIIASTNACCPDNVERNKMGFNATEPYKDKLRNNLDLLRSYGIDTTVSENLADKVNQVLKRSYGIKKIDTDKPIKNYSAIKVDEKVISRSCILNNSNFSIIKVDKNAVVTDLAAEEAAKLNIKLIKE